ncbi:MAG: metallophosphoesterase family protein [Solobacterium sp.]|nr:metallophosphoesterase family protein [Solobacterium sp.]
MKTIGIISDTHNLLRPEVLARLSACDLILHGGDISRPQVLEELMKLAPVQAVRGNNDRDWPEDLPYTLDLDVYGLRVFMTHKKSDLPADLSPYDMVIFGHSHKYDLKKQGDTVLLNPGSCGPRRFTQPITMAVMVLQEDGNFTIERIDIPHEDRK